MSTFSWYFYSFTPKNYLEVDPKSQKWDFEEIACTESTRRHSLNYLHTLSIRCQISPLWCKGKIPVSEAKGREFESHLGQKIYNNIFSFCYLYNLPYKFTFNKRLDEFKSPRRHLKRTLNTCHEITPVIKNLTFQNNYKFWWRRGKTYSPTTKGLVFKPDQIQIFGNFFWGQERCPTSKNQPAWAPRTQPINQPTTTIIIVLNK